MEGDLKCKGCKERYSQARVPRLVPLCGHSICEHCLASLVVPEDDHFAFRCAQDDVVMGVPDNGLSQFPINIDLLRLAGQAPLPFALQVSKILKSEVLDDDSELMSTIQGLSDKDKSKSGNQSQSFEEAEICPVHKEKIKNVCIEHHKKICSDCALFGEHKGHDVMKIQDVVHEASLKAEKALMISNEITEVQAKKLGSRLAQELGKACAAKREKLVHAIRGKFNRVVELLRKEEKKCIDKAESLLYLVQEVSRERVKCPEDLAGRVIAWQNAVLQMANAVTESFQDVEELVKYVVEGRDNNMLKQGAVLLTEIERYHEQQVSFHEKELADICVDFGNDLEAMVPDFCLVQRAEPKIVPPRPRKKELTKLRESGGFLQIPLAHPVPPKDEELLVDELVQDVVPQLQFKAPVMTVSQSEPKLRSPRREQRDVDSSFVVAKQTKKKAIKVPQRFEGVLEDIKSGKSEVADFTNSEVGDATILQLMDLLRGNQRLKGLKLIRCKLTDEAVGTVYQTVQGTNIMSLNLSQNGLSERAVDLLLESGLEGRTVTLSQNKINVRNIKAKIDRLKKAGVGVTL